MPFERTYEDEAHQRKADYMREWARRNKDRVNAERQRKYAEQVHSPEFLEAKRQADKERYYKNLELVRAQARERARRYRERKGSAFMSAKTKEWAKAHPEWFVAHNAVQNSRRRAAGILTTKQWQDIQAAYGHRCHYCKKKRQLTPDHIVPISKGGTTEPSNIVPACLSCNMHKHNSHRDAQPVLLV